MDDSLMESLWGYLMHNTIQCTKCQMKVCVQEGNTKKEIKFKINGYKNISSSFNHGQYASIEVYLVIIYFVEVSPSSESQTFDLSYGEPPINGPDLITDFETSRPGAMSSH
jgi:hypothetical protein